MICDEKLPTQLEVSLPFSHAQVLQLIKKELTELSERGQKKHSVKVTWDDVVLEFLSAGFNTKFGARSIQNVVQKKVLPVYRLGKEKETFIFLLRGRVLWLTYKYR